jgi:Domain of unknown function (DUF4296)
MKFHKILIILVIVFGCKPKNDDKPNNLIPKAKMAKLLADIHILEGKVNKLGVVNTDTTSFIFRKYEAELFKKHEIDTTEYFESYKYYLINPDDFTDVYKQAVEIIKEKNKVDSLQNAKLQKERPKIKTIDSSEKINERKFQSNFFKRKYNLDSLKAIKKKTNRII